MSGIKADKYAYYSKVFPKIDRELCVGCHLCVHVCLTGAISSANRIKKIK